MNDETLRAMIRESVARHLARTHGQDGAPHPDAGTPMPAGDELARKYGVLPMHPSHYRYSALPESSGPCYIEPDVSCTHCGFCESHGH